MTLMKSYSFCALIAALMLVHVLRAGAPPKMPGNAPIPPQIAVAQKDCPLSPAQCSGFSSPITVIFESARNFL